jgi:hypothetical protein
MAEIVLRVDHTVTHSEPDTVEAQTVIDRAISTRAADFDVLRCKHGDRLVALYSRGVAAIEVAPRGAVL